MALNKAVLLVAFKQAVLLVAFKQAVLLVAFKQAVSNEVSNYMATLMVSRICFPNMSRPRLC